MPKAPTEDPRTRMEREAREAWVRRTSILIRTLAVVGKANEEEGAVPSPEVVSRVGEVHVYGDRWDHDRRVRDALRRLQRMGLVVTEKFKYESVTRWSLTEVGSDVWAEAEGWARA